jgi:hypothetical protein
VRSVPRGEVGLRGEWHAEPEGKPCGGRGGIGAPELGVVEIDHVEAIGGFLHDATNGGGGSSSSSGCRCGQFLESWEGSTA